MLTLRRERNFSSVTPANCAAKPVALCHRLSRSTLVTVSYRSTAYPMSVRAIADCDDRSRIAARRT